ncbi:immunoglobulin-like domain-containing protein [Thalassobellus citreus]|uniref:immunoglobulin-like domain-containing protein n=1 Tax=Thalassobellus citreus TaxID=3367752 RepID=UPI003791EA1A
MKKILMSLVCITTLFLSSCTTDTTGDVSKVTVFPEISAKGDPVMFLELGGTFADPGASASVAGAPVEFQTSSNVDNSTPGFYTVNYSVENSDGFEAVAFRTVIVYENNGTVAGVYWGRRTTRGIESPILVSTRSDGNFNCTDILGGYYEQSTNNYGPNYGADAVITVDISAGTVTSTGSTIGFGPVSMSGGTISADGRTMNWTGTLDNYAFGFPVELVKITP